MSITKKSSSSAEAESSNTAANANSATTAAATAETDSSSANSSDHSDITIYGQQPPKEETPEFLSSSFAELDRELDSLPDEKKSGWLKAKEKCPELVGDDHRLMFLSMLENNESAQRLGIVVVGYPHHVKLSHVDRKLLKMNMESMTGCIPIRLGALHICHPPWFFSKIVFPIIKIVVSERIRKRVRIHSGSKEDVLKELEGFGLSKKDLPVDIGGDVVLPS
ncbi:hypothetical protein ACHAXS_007351 [Conticribra weissflogii]